MTRTLLDAIQSGDVAATRRLATRDAVNARGEGGVTPLMLAAGLGQREAVAGLLAAGADVNAADERGFTALFYGCHNGDADRGYPDVVDALLAAGADPMARNEGGRTALMMVKDRDYVDVINILHEAEMKVEAGSCGSRNAPDMQVVTFLKRDHSS